MTTVAQPPAILNADLALKILRRALDPATPEPEAHTSAVKFVQCCRRERVQIEHLTTVLAPVRIEYRDPADREPSECRREMPFGKFKGLTIGEIADRDPGYVRWAIENLRDAEIVRCFQVTAWYYDISTEAA